jgi:hypothetical protein
MRQSRVDDCCFVGKNGVICVLHVDDFLSTGPPAALAEFRNKLYAKYDMSGGLVKEYYGLDFNTAHRTVTVTAKGYIERACRKLGIKPGTWLTPMETDLTLPKLSGECTNKILHSRYRSLVGAINHAAVTVRVDVAVAVRELASHLVHPNAVHVKAAERVMGYLYHTRDMGLRYTGEGDTARPLCLSFFGTCDASHNVTHDAKGITGWAYQLQGACISWHCKAQKLTCLSSTESELVAVDSAVREIRGLVGAG